MSTALYDERDQIVRNLDPLIKRGVDKLNPIEKLDFRSLERQLTDIDHRIDAVEGVRTRSSQVTNTEARDAAVRSSAPSVGMLGDPSTGPNPYGFEARGSAARLTVNERPSGHYSRDGEGRSWFADLYAARSGDHAAMQRITRSQDETRSEYEARGLSMGTAASGGYAVPPVDLIADFRAKAEAYAPMLTLVNVQPLPEYGDSIRVPRQDGSTAAAIHTELAPIAETDATITQDVADVYHWAGLQTLSIELVERSPANLDAFLLDNLAKRIAIGQDRDFLTGSGTGAPKGISKVCDDLGNVISYTDGTATFPELLPKLALAVQGVALGVHAPPTAMVGSPRRGYWALSQLDADGRPYLRMEGGVGTSNPVVEGVAPIANVLSIPFYADSQVPTNLGTGTDEDFVVVGRMSEATAWLGVPAFEIDMSRKFDVGGVQVRARQYGAFTVHDGAAFQKVIGTGLAAVL